MTTGAEMAYPSAKLVEDILSRVAELEGEAIRLGETNYDRSSRATIRSYLEELRGNIKQDLEELAERSGSPSQAVTDAEVREALRHFMANGVVKDATLEFHGGWMRRALEDFISRRQSSGRGAGDSE